VTSKLFFLKNYLHKIGAYNESLEVNSLIKEATLTGLKTLGLKNSAANLFNNKFGSKWDVVIAKWMIEFYLGRSSFEDYSTYRSKDDFIQAIKAMNGCDELLSIGEEKRQSASEKSKNIQNLENWCSASDYDFSSAWKTTEPDEWMRSFYKKTEPISPYSTISSWSSDLEKIILDRIKYFTDDAFVKDVLSGKFLNSSVLKKMTYADAEGKWRNKMENSLPEVMKFNDGWRWLDAGNGKSTFVAEKLKNCGSSSWGNLRATSESAKKARMYILFDPGNDAHAIATWNPEYVDSYYPDNGPVKYLGHIEGGASSPVKPEYYKYIIDLINLLNPDKINIHDKTIHYSDGTILSSDKLKDYINENNSLEKKWDFKY